MTLLKFTLADDTTHSFADFENAIRFCEDEFGYDDAEQDWNDTKKTLNQLELYTFLKLDGIEVDLVHE